MGFGFGGVWMLLLFSLGLFLLFALLGRPERVPAQAGEERPKDVLRERYARGELSCEAYLQQLKDLEGYPWDADRAVGESTTRASST